MKTIKSRMSQLARVFLALFLLTIPAFCQPGPPPLPITPLNFWYLDQPNWPDWWGDAPLRFANLNTAPGWASDVGTALSVDTNCPAFLNYCVVDAYGDTNISLVAGTISFWFQPNFTSTTDLGDGPTNWACLLSVGQWTSNASASCWSLAIDPDGTNLVFLAQLNGASQTVLAAPIDFDAGDWHNICLTYSPTNCCLYLEGQPVTNTGPIAYLPDTEYGFFVGSESTGVFQARGQFQNLETYDGPQSAADIARDYTETSAVILNSGGSIPTDGGSYTDDLPSLPGGGSTNSSDGGGITNYGYTLPNYTITTNYANYTNFWLAVTNSQTQVFVSVVSTLPGLTYEILTNADLATTNWGVCQTLLASNSITSALPTDISSSTLFFHGLLVGYPGIQPVLNPPPGVYATVQQVGVTFPAPGVTIRYTTDGTIPTVFSPIVPSNSFIPVAYSITLRVGAFSNNLPAGVSGGNYYVVGAIAAGFDHALYLNPYGNIYAWGDNSSGEVGDGTSINASTPTAVLSVSNVTKVAASDWFSAAEDKSGGLFAWGENYGILGTGTESDQEAIPVPMLLTNAVAIALGDSHGLAITTNGNVWSWGDNWSGQLGNGSANFNPEPAPTVVAGIGDVSAIGVGYAHSLAISNGFVYGWGDNSYGQLGSDPKTNEVIPVLIAGISNVTSVQGSWENSYALRSNNTVWAWGDNVLGELGIGTYEAASGPVQVAGLSNIISISASPSGTYCLALKNDGTVWAWGGNDGDDYDPSVCGQLGNGTCNSTNMPTMVVGLSNIVSISAGGIFAMALQNNGTVWAWGDNSAGELGDFGGSSTNTPVQIISPNYYRAQFPVLTIVGGNNQIGTSGTFLASPLLVQVTNTNGAVLTNAPIAVQVTGGDAQVVDSTNRNPSSSIMVVTDKNGIATVWVCLGTNENDTIAVFAINATNSVPVEFSEFVAVSAPPAPVITPSESVFSQSQSVIITCADTNAIICYTTDGSQPTTSSPTIGSGVGLLLTNSTELMATAFQSGTNSGTVAGNYLKVISAIACGENHIISLIKDGTVVAWGDNSDGQIGVNGGEASSGPVPVTGLSNIVAVAAGAYHSVALDSNGLVWAWGDNSDGQLGGTTNLQSDMPIMVDGFSNAVGIAAGFSNSFAILSDGSLWAWGNNDGGQLGTGDQMQHQLPVLVNKVTNAIEAAAGPLHSLTLLANGVVLAWGDNSVGELGNGTTTSSLIPVQVPGLSNVIAISAGEKNSFALKSDNTIWAWGWFGLGNGNNKESNVPIQISNLTATAISANGYNDEDGDYSETLALATNGSIFTWGKNQLTNQPSYLFSPVSVVSVTNAISIHAGGTFSAALMTDLSISVWGQNDYGVFGPSVPSMDYFGPVNIADDWNVDNTYTPGDFYQGRLPNLSIQSGNLQAGSPGSDLQEPLIVQVADNSGNPLVNAPITFDAGSGGVLLSSSSNGATWGRILVATDGNGLAAVQAYLGTNDPSTITASATSGTNSVSVVFSEYIAPIISIASPTNGGTYLVGLNQGLTVTANAQAAAGASIEEVDFYCQTNSDGSITSLGVSAQSPYSFTWTNSLWWTNAFFSQSTLLAVAVDDQGAQSEPQNVTVTIALDSDGIGIPDYWQLQYFGYVGVNPNSSPDGNGQTLLFDYQNGINPTDYYGGTLPSLEILSGNDQAGNCDSFLPQPVIIGVAGVNSAALTDAPVTFTVVSGTALLAATINDTPVASLALRSDTNGQALAWVYFPSAGTNPPDSTIVVSASSGSNSTSISANEFVPLGHWTFNNTNTWIGEEGQLPLLVANVVGVPGWSSNAVLVDYASPAMIAYNVVETNGDTNIACQTGSITFWFKPDWSSTNAGGDGPGTWGRLIEMGSNGYDLSTNLWLDYSTNGWWTLYLNPAGTQLLFGTSTNGGGMENLSAGISWNSNEWYQIALTYSPTNCALYVDGQLLTNGYGVTFYPNASDLTNGFRIGSDQNGNNQANGAFDELETFNYPLAATNAVTSSGEIPDWWLVMYFGGLYGTALDLDSQGNTLLSDYQNGADPSIIGFSIAMTNNRVNTASLTMPLNVTWGVPAYMSVLVDTNPVTVYTNGPINFAAVTWQPYSQNNVVSLNSGDGNYSVWVGLKGCLPTAQATWQLQRLVLDTTPPILTITNPAAVVSQPTIQVQGYANKALSSLTFDVSNATGIWTNQTSYITGQLSDTNLLAITTNYFQCYDVALTTNGVNLVTLHATDVAGNTATTNIAVTLNYSGAIPPAITVIWPQDGTEISGSQFTFEGHVDDLTAAITASIVDENGNTNTVQGLVERNGMVWVQNLQLSDGENTLTITATDAAANISTTNLTLYQSSVIVEMNPVAGAQLNQSSTSVTGTVSDPSYTVTVNGVTATVVSGGTWEADNVPVEPGTTTVFDVEVYSGEQTSGDLVSPNASLANYSPGIRADGANNLVSDGSQFFTQVPPVNVVPKSYSCHEVYFVTPPGIFGMIGYYPGEPLALWAFGPAYGIGWRDTTWTLQSGGIDKGYAYSSGNYIERYEVWPVYCSTWDNILAPGTNSFNPPWESDPVEDIQTRVMIQPSGPAVAGATVTYLIQAQAQYIGGGGQVPPTAIQVCGVALTLATNSDGSVWGDMLLQSPAGASPDVTPTTSGSYTYIVKAFPVNLQVQANGNPLDPVQNNVTFCVGQQINFSLTATQSLPTSFTNNVLCNWTLPDTANYVNFAFPPNSAGCTNYTNNPSLLVTTNSPCTCWYINGTGGTVSVGANLIMPSGPSISIASIGKFAIDTPTVTEPIGWTQMPYQGTFYQGTIQQGEISSLILDKNDMNFGFTITSDYDGVGNYAQLVQADCTGDLPPYYQVTGSYRLDNTYPFNSDSISISANGNNVWFYDLPSFAGNRLIDINNHYETYLIFKPDPQESSIWITLKKITWAWAASAQLPINSLTWNIYNPPALITSGPSDSDEFPVWQSTLKNGWPAVPGP
jgi:alpha-tubulin suppressor-like RCC1 family protein